MKLERFAFQKPTISILDDWSGINTMHMERIADMKTGMKYAGDVETPTNLTVYTSSQCLFCEQALHAAKEVAKSSSIEGLALDVIEINVDSKPEILEQKRIMALPTIMIGHHRIIGIPREDELKHQLHKAVMNLS